MLPIFFAILLSSAFANEISPPECTAGGGSASDIRVFVTGLSGVPPYNMDTLVDYQVNFTFVPTVDSSSPRFKVSAAPTKFLGITLPPPPLPQIAVKEAAAGPFTANQPALASLTFQIPLVFGLFEALFQGNVYDSVTSDVVACRQGIVHVNPNIPLIG